MKQLFNATAISGSKGNYFANFKRNQLKLFRTLVYMSMIVLAIFFTGCQKEQTNTTSAKEENIATKSMQSESNVVNDYTGISNQTDYNVIISQLIPKQNQEGLGKPLSVDQWKRNA